MVRCAPRASLATNCRIPALLLPRREGSACIDCEKYHVGRRRPRSIPSGSSFTRAAVSIRVMAAANLCTSAGTEMALALNVTRNKTTEHYRTYGTERLCSQIQVP